MGLDRLMRVSAMGMLAYFATKTLMDFFEVPGLLGASIAILAVVAVAMIDTLLGLRRMCTFLQGTSAALQASRRQYEQESHMSDEKVATIIIDVYSGGLRPEVSVLVEIDSSSGLMPQDLAGIVHAASEALEASEATAPADVEE